MIFIIKVLSCLFHAESDLFLGGVLYQPFCCPYFGIISLKIKSNKRIANELTSLGLLESIDRIKSNPVSYNWLRSDVVFEKFPVFVFISHVSLDYSANFINLYKN